MIIHTTEKISSKVAENIKTKNYNHALAKEPTSNLIL